MERDILDGTASLPSLYGCLERECPPVAREGWFVEDSQCQLKQRSAATRSPILRLASELHDIIPIAECPHR